MLTRMVRLKRIIAPVCVSVFAYGPSLAQELSYGFSTEFVAGEFGLGRSADLFIAAVDTTWSIDKWEFGVFVPLVRASGPVPVEEQHGRPSFNQPTATFVDETQSGLGDVSLSASRYFAYTRRKVLLRASTIVKLPTADPDKLLGTGEPDLGLRADVVRGVGALSVSLGGGYVFSGRTSQFDLQNRAEARVGAFAQASSRYGVGASIDWRQSIVRGAPDPFEATGYVSANLTSRARTTLFATTGFSDGSPDYGVGLRIVVE